MDYYPGSPTDFRWLPVYPGTVNQLRGFRACAKALLTVLKAHSTVFLDQSGLEARKGPKVN